MKIVVNGFVFDTEKDIVTLVWNTDEERQNFATNIANMSGHQVNEARPRVYCSIPDCIETSPELFEHTMNEAELLASVDWENADDPRIFGCKTMSSCLLKADATEPIFVLRAKDPLAAMVISMWVQLNEQFMYHELIKNAHALQLIEVMIEWRKHKGLPELSGPINPNALQQSKRHDNCFVVPFIYLPGATVLLQQILHEVQDQPITAGLKAQIENMVACWADRFIEKGEAFLRENCDVQFDMNEGSITGVTCDMHVYKEVCTSWHSRH